MAVAYEGHLSKAYEKIITALSGSARFQTRCGAANATAALSYICEADCDMARDQDFQTGPLPLTGARLTWKTAKCWAHINDAKGPQTIVAYQTSTRAGQLMIHLWLAPARYLTPPDTQRADLRLRAVRSDAETIATEVQTLARAGTSFGAGVTIDLLGIEVPDDRKDDFRAWYIATLTVSWRSPA